MADKSKRDSDEGSDNYIEIMRTEGDQQEDSDIDYDEDDIREGRKKIIPMAAFVYFCHTERRKLRAEFPQWTENEIGHEVGRRWNDTDDEERARLTAVVKSLPKPEEQEPEKREPHQRVPE